MQNQPKCLVIDIETSPIVAHVWGLRDQNISLSQIVKDWQVIAFAAKWLGESKVFYTDTRRDKDDKSLLKQVWQLLDEADILITQNGQNFDSRKLNARFIQYGMKPPKPYRHLDTYKIAKAAAEFTSHKLEYLTEKLCVKYKKLSHKKFPGMSLWNECLKGNTAAWNEMRTYNIRDVLSTEELYTKLQGWTPKTAPSASLIGCVSCGSMAVEKRGTDRTAATLWQRLHCTSCGKWFRGLKVKETK
jgi:DNA polymerase elongation subunit (family B)